MVKGLGSRSDAVAKGGAKELADPKAAEGRPLPCLPPASHSLRALFEALPRRSPAPRLCRPILAGRSPAPLQTKLSKASAPNIDLFCRQREFFASSLIGVVPLSVSFCSKMKTGGGATVEWDDTAVIPPRDSRRGSGAPTSPLASLKSHAEEDLRVPGQENLGSHRQPLQTRAAARNPWRVEFQLAWSLAAKEGLFSVEFSSFVRSSRHRFRDSFQSRFGFHPVSSFRIWHL